MFRSSLLALVLTVSVVAVAAVVGTAAPASAQTPTRTFTVTSTADAVDMLPGDGRCVAWTGACTLRAAVMEANRSGGATIVLPAGRFALTLAPGVLDRALQVVPVIGDDRGGDLDLKVPVTIKGAGASRTTVDARQLHRVFQVQPLARASISDITLTGGRMEGTFGDGILEYSGGGAIWNAAELNLNRVTVTGNSAGFGGGVFNDPLSTASFTDSTIAANTAGEAGGVRCDARCTFTNTTVRDNVVVDPQDPTRPGSLAGTGGGVDIRGVLPVSFVGSRITGNTAVAGGGINVAPAYLDTFPEPPVGAGTVVSLKDTVVTGNAPGDCRAQFARFQDLGGNSDSDSTCGVT